MKKGGVLCLLCLFCTLCVGCHIQFGSNVLVATYRKTPAEAYMDVPYNNQITHTYLDTIDSEIACISVSGEEVLWVAVLNGNNIIEMPMLINEQNEYCALGDSMVCTIDSKGNIEGNDEIYFPSKSFTLASGEGIYSYFYTEEEYETIKEQLEEYTAISFVVELEEVNCNLVYVYSVK